MRNQPSKRALQRVALFAAAACMWACSEPPPNAKGGQGTADQASLADFASGVDAEFGVETFALSSPTLVVLAPIQNFAIATDFTVVAPITVNVCMTTSNVNIGTNPDQSKIICYLDGDNPLITQTLVGANDPSGCLAGSYKVVFSMDQKLGMHAVECHLADQAGQLLTDLTAHDTKHFYITQTALSTDPANKCTKSADCDDGNACSQEMCSGINGFQCVFSFIPGCCNSTKDCATGAGETCITPNSATAKCSACTADSDCLDSDPCTTDKCDLSGAKGVCTNVKADPQCCSQPGDLCDDGKACTVDSCDMAGPGPLHTCKHVLPLGACCQASDCTGADVCQVASCIDLECRYQKDNFKPDCCSDAVNVKCDDKNPCTVDACDIAQSNWKQCSHTQDPSKPKCCDILNFGTQCNDGNACTQDTCVNYQCISTQVSDCCKADLDCDDYNLCTADSCYLPNGSTAGNCKHNKTAECCVSPADCDDGLFCTAESCNLLNNTCKHTKTDPSCCDTNAECDDSDPCSADACLNHYCVHGIDSNKPNCCSSKTLCNDQNPCTVDTCDLSSNTCAFTSTGDPSCCKTQADCADTDCTTLDYCDATNVCKHKPYPDACSLNIDCDDGSPCTTDTCDKSSGCGACKHVQDPTCCLTNAECDDSLPKGATPANPNAACTLDKCVAGACTHAPQANCCLDDTDALKSCDDKDGCTIEYCVNNQCRHTLPKNGCCASSGDCDDNDKCTADSCGSVDPATKMGSCVHGQIAGCTCTPTGVFNGTECNDNNSCTTDACVNGVCSHAQVANCCLDKYDCNDGNACTADYCIQNDCTHYSSVGGSNICCSIATQDVDCAYLNSACAKGVCSDQADGSKKCVASKIPVCTVNIGYCQDFASSPDLATMGWNPADVKASAASHWVTSTAGALGPDQYAHFNWAPVAVGYQTCLASPIIQAAGAQTITMQFDREFLWNVGSTNFKVLGSLDGAAADWTTAPAVHAEILNADANAATVDFVLPPSLSGSNGLRLAICLDGTSTANTKGFGVDNVCVVKGQKPLLNKCPTDQIVPYGAKKYVPIKATDLDPDAVLSFSLVTAPSFVSLSSALYYWLDTSWNTTLTINPTTTDQVGTWPVTVKVSDGSLYSTCTFNITVTYKGGYLVWRPIEVPAAAGNAIFQGIKAQGKIVQHITDLSLYPDLTGFSGVFVALGVYPSNHVLQEPEAAVLKLYLAQAGRVYMEGGDTWVFDTQTTLHPLFKESPGVDSLDTGISGPLAAMASPYIDIYQNPVKDYLFAYDQSPDWNNVNDTMYGNLASARTRNILANNSNADQVVQVAHDDDSNYRTVASSILVGGVQPGPDTSNDMVSRVLNFFDNGFVECKGASDCDDNNSCTNDLCSTGICSHPSVCSCTANASLTCGGSLSVVSNGSGSTTSVSAYSCDPNNVYAGKEMTTKFSPSSSAPVTMTVSNLTNPKVRWFVLKAAGSECDPSACIATGDGSQPIKFPGAQGATYYIVLDTPTGEVGQADIKFSCGAPENCSNGLDDNGNGLIDCADLDSCCGDAACGEICDGVDNNCDGKVDENCNKDNDGYCDAQLTVIGTPPVCPKGTGDCNDNQATVNPGMPEICANGKDDNCNGVQDEEGSVGCVNYWVDGDGDGFGGGSSKCLCSASATYTVKKGGDCDDTNVKVNPAAIEICGNNIDDDCSGTQNDINAQGCSDFYTDVDVDQWGVLPKKCLCFGAGQTTATKPGDCNDTNAAINPDQAESCNNFDDNCNSLIDEGCDDDGDGYCDASMGYSSVGGTTKKCATGTEGTSLTITCVAGSTITNVDFASYGNPVGSCGSYAAGTCNSPTSLQVLKNLCVGKATCTVGVNNTIFGDACFGTPKTLDVQVTCTSKTGTPPDICPKGPGDTVDTDPSINPGGKEICDGMDNNSDGLIDEGCDDDGDGYCDAAMITIGAPAVCPKTTAKNGFGDDCDDTKVKVNPAANEDCSTAYDDNCNGLTNEINGAPNPVDNCTIYFSDSDSDGYGVKDFKCMCAPVGLFKAKKTADCNDANASINPGAVDICNGIDDNCDGKTDEGCDDDGDGYCDASLPAPIGNIAACPQGGGDCDDTNKNINPGKIEICNNGVDDNCNGTQNDAGAINCSTFYSDVDTDSYGSNTSKCLCNAAGTFTATNNLDCNDNDATINPQGTEICDGVDDNCDGTIDEGCDDDKDGYCDINMQMTSNALCANSVKPAAGKAKAGDDCNDTDKTIHPSSGELCDNVDQDCNGVTDEGCDDDKDGYCDATMVVSTPLPTVCPKGPGDCDDYNSDQNPGAPEVCGNGIDDNCNGSQNDVNAVNCTKFYFDGDADTYGLNIAQCLCVPAGSYTATLNNDCNDSVASIHPGAPEMCSTAADDNCNGDTNDPGAVGCKVYFFDSDQDGFGLTGLSQCLCIGANNFTASVGTDCNDTSAAVNPGKPELCDNIDNNCDSKVDEGCDDDGDKYCDSTMTTVGLPNVCPYGAGDCNDNNANANPGFVEQCDNIDNNCNAQTDEGCNADGDGYCTTAMKVIGFPTICNKGTGDCNDANNLVNPGVNENCATPVDDNCNGDTNDVGATGCLAFGVDLDGDTYSDKNLATKCMCKAAGNYTGTKAGDCQDQNNLVNPGMPELCDGIDNNCDGAIDEKCDADGDGYCSALLVTVGKPAACPKGGGDCDDTKASINPGAAELCSTAVDDNCNGSTNDQNATGCTNFYMDGDSDGWAVNASQCLCVPSGGWKALVAKVGDCDDTIAAVNPSATEICGNGVDDNCNGTQNDVGASGCVNFYADGDTDGYGIGAGSCQCFAQGVYITPLNGDCDDTNKLMNPGLSEQCDGFDNNCNLTTDEGCDDDGDKWCDVNMVVIGKPPVCSLGSGDCNDTVASINPAGVEICDNIDQNCDGTTDNGCDDDKDAYCDKSMTVVGTPVICTKGGNDCDDGNAMINPGKTEICDDLDNNCNGVTDELCDQDGDKFCDLAKTVIGTPKACILGGGDCNDLNAAVNPNATEICNNIDDNCAGGTDEVCKDTDGDGYCVGAVAVSAGCPKGGNDCDDTNKNINPGMTETCATQFDDNCDGIANKVNATACKNFYTDVDADGYGTGAAVCQCLQVGTLSALVNGDCNDSVFTINPNATEICDGIDNNCNGSTDEGCDDDADQYCDSSMLIASTATCTKSVKPAVGKTIPGDDCNDAVASANPGGTEICDGVDNNCNSLIDEGCDDDHDLYCDSAMTVVGTPAVCPSGKNDCDDNNKAVNPGAVENCSTPYDDNCDGSLNALNAVGCKVFYTDADGDGYGVSPTACYCVATAPYTATVGGDCDDTKNTVYPAAAAEICDALDNDCNGVTDEGCDADGDGYCDATKTVTKTNACPKTTITGGKGDDCAPFDKLVNPGAIEICDDQDNNCNAQVDELCDKDGDKYCDSTKQIVGTPAICTKGGGDCNDSDATVNLGATEVCNGKDDNCNKIVDEAGATGCTTWYYDGDQDGVGVASSQCLCGATGLYSSKTNNDCNDNCPTCAPGKPEVCDGSDNNCNGQVDEGCNPDGDGYCTALMTTVGTPPVCSKGGGDCNESSASINPGATELCNNVDDNCNSVIDEGAGSACVAPNANMICQAGACAIGSCQAGFYNLNGSLSDGCECNGSDPYEPNNTCGAAYVIDANLQDNNAKDLIAARIVDATDDDWFAFYGADTSDSGYGACDKYNVRAVFTANPGGLAFDISRGGCPNGANNVCCGQTDFNWFTNYKSNSSGQPSAAWSEYGECPCQTNLAFDQSNSGWSIPPGYPGGGGPYCMNYNSGYVCIPTGYYMTYCQDDSAWYYMRVYKASGAASCSSYKIEVSNGVYGQPGTGNGQH